MFRFRSMFLPLSPKRSLRCHQTWLWKSPIYRLGSLPEVDAARGHEPHDAQQEETLSFREDNLCPSKTRGLPESLPDKILGFWKKVQKETASSGRPKMIFHFLQTTKFKVSRFSYSWYKNAY